ncbi:CAP domain-containing protein [Paracoccus liaowanqingii]|uniref:CAP domain-containing protein n=1 Tax=Paracoccus liaowanqingii TaxID=2560053 RepID=A0A4Z1BSN8_9RHOB|nr:CAP domain-containing protein [Paracoccus liaowanqingii]
MASPGHRSRFVTPASATDGTRGYVPTAPVADRRSVRRGQDRHLKFRFNHGDAVRETDQTHVPCNPACPAQLISRKPGGTTVQAHSVLTSVILVNVLSGPFAPPASAQDLVEMADLREAALERTNASRSEADLASLAHSDVLDAAAQSHAADMLTRGYHSHVSPDGETPFDRFLAAGGNSWSVSGENIATCTGCTVPPDLDRIQAFHDGWMQSPGHRRNILSAGFDSFGFGIAGSGSTVYAVQTFSGPGEDEGGAGSALSPEQVAGTALQQINDARADAGLGPLEADADLDEAADRVLDHLAEDRDDLPENIFELLPEGSTGWTSLAVQTATLGGSGASIGRGDLSAIISDWEQAANPREILGGPTASHVGFAADAAGGGRLSAVALFGGR